MSMLRTGFTSSESVATGVIRPSGSEVEQRLVWSASLHEPVRVLVYPPPGYRSGPTAYPSVYVLHGTPGTPDSIFSVLGLADELDAEIASGAVPPIIAVVPTGGPTPDSDTEWSDSFVHPSQRWGSFLSADVVAWVDRTFRTRT